jgi:hypothetical protein
MDVEMIQKPEEEVLMVEVKGLGSSSLECRSR